MSTNAVIILKNQRRCQLVQGLIVRFMIINFSIQFVSVLYFLPTIPCVVGVPNLHFITPSNKWIFVTVAQLEVRPPGIQEVAGSNTGWSLKVLWRKLSRCLAGVLLLY